MVDLEYSSFRVLLEHQTHPRILGERPVLPLPSEEQPHRELRQVRLPKRSVLPDVQPEVLDGHLPVEVHGHPRCVGSGTGSRRPWSREVGYGGTGRGSPSSFPGSLSFFGPVGSVGRLPPGRLPPPRRSPAPSDSVSDTFSRGAKGRYRRPPTWMVLSPLYHSVLEYKVSNFTFSDM